MAHEVTHCYQQRAVDDPGNVISAPQWVKEGEATWAMVAAVPLGSKVVEDHWDNVFAVAKNAIHGPRL